MNTTLTPADLDPRRQAMLLYFQGYRVARIAEMLGEKVATVHSWKKRDKWGDYGPLDQMQLTTAARYCQLIMKEHKEGKDFKEIDLLARQSERHARIGKFNNGGNEADLNPNVANRNKGPRRQPEKNVYENAEITANWHHLRFLFRGMIMLIGYVRVSTNDQNTDLQRNALNCAGCERIFEDKISGTKSDRPGLKKLLRTLSAGDTLVVWKLDRLGRSMRHLVTLIEELRQRGVNFRSLTDSIDTSTPMGRFFFHVMGALAEMERELIVERTRAGLAAARAKGRVGGRRPKLTTEQWAQIGRLLEAGESRQRIALIFDVGVSTIYRKFPANKSNESP
ncbi:TPA: helix-turn-helix domain-containing protein [Escherichia coli]|nr:helix-turn-helix domain-containing protein [Escherichia coli]